MSNSIIRSLQLSETRYFLVGVVGGLVIFILQLGGRWIALLSGGAIALGALVYWFWQTRSSLKAEASSANLLQLDVFVAHLDCDKARVPPQKLEAWMTAQDPALTIWAIAAQLAQRESLLIPDLLETLHSTLDLTEQTAEALHLITQIQTPDFQNRAQQQMQNSLGRLQVTQLQLQTLADRFAWEGLEQKASQETSALAIGLRMLVAENGKSCEL
jgi:hypothetical protein